MPGSRGLDCWELAHCFNWIFRVEQISISLTSRKPSLPVKGKEREPAGSEGVSAVMQNDTGSQLCPCRLSQWPGRLVEVAAPS